MSCYNHDDVEMSTETKLAGLVILVQALGDCDLKQGCCHKYKMLSHASCLLSQIRPNHSGTTSVALLDCCLDVATSCHTFYS